MCNASNRVRDGIYMATILIFLIILILHGIVELINRNKKRPHLTNRNDLISFTDEIVHPFNIIRESKYNSILKVELNMVEEQKGDIPINQIAGGYHEVFNVIIPATKITDKRDTLMTWTSSNGTMFKVIKNGYTDGIILSLEKDPNVNIIGTINSSVLI